MATFQRFEDIEAWQRARKLTYEIYTVSNKSPFSKDFGLRDQIRGASVSIMSTSLKALKEAGQKNSCNSFQWQKAPPVNFGANSMLPLTRAILKKRRLIGCSLQLSKIAE